MQKKYKVMDYNLLASQSSCLCCEEECHVCTKGSIVCAQ